MGKKKWWQFAGSGLDTPAKKVLAVVLIFVAGLMALTTWGISPLNIYPVAGLSMEPTIHQWLYIPARDPNIRHRGALVHIDRGKTPVVGNIVMFRDKTGGVSVKRVAEIRGDGTFWVTADNVGMTGADSREYGWIKPNQIIGVVDHIYTPVRFWRIFTTQGKIRNTAELIRNPRTIHYGSCPYWAVQNEFWGFIEVFVGEDYIVSFQDSFISGWWQNQLRFKKIVPKKGYEEWVWTPQYGALMIKKVYLVYRIIPGVEVAKYLPKGQDFLRKSMLSGGNVRANTPSDQDPLDAFSGKGWFASISGSYIEIDLGTVKHVSQAGISCTPMYFSISLSRDGHKWIPASTSPPKPIVKNVEFRFLQIKRSSPDSLTLNIEVVKGIDIKN